MARIWNGNYLRLYWTEDHEFLPGENVPPFDWELCWNCGGDGAVEYSDSFGIPYEKECPVCDAVMEIRSSNEQMFYDYENWPAAGPNQTFLILDQRNILNKFWVPAEEL